MFFKQSVVGLRTYPLNTASGGRRHPHTTPSTHRPSITQEKGTDTTLLIKIVVNNYVRS